MEISKDVLKGKDEEMQKVIQLSLEDEVKLKKMISPVLRYIMTVRNSNGANVLEVELKSIAEEIGYKYVGIEKWEGEVVLVIEKFKDNFYIQMGVTGKTITTKIGETVTIAEINKQK